MRLAHVCGADAAEDAFTQDGGELPAGRFLHDLP